MMTFVSSLIAALLTTAPASQPNQCARFMGQTLQTTTFEAVREGLPQIEARGAYETTADYERRVAAAQESARPAIIRLQRWRFGMSYDADRQELKIDAMVFGAGELAFNDIFGSRGLRPRDDNYLGAIGFVVEDTETGRSTYEGTNGFGARAAVQSTEHRVFAVWERPGRLGESQFLGVRPYRDVAVLRVGSAEAREIIENGGTALMIVPRAPFIRTGRSDSVATFSNPREQLRSVTVLTADIQCAFLLNGQARVIVALEVR